MPDIADLDVQVNLVDDNKNPSVNFEDRWHQLAVVVNDLQATLISQQLILDDYEARIFALENP